MKLRFATALLALMPLTPFAAEVIDLSGTWHVSLDRDDSGREERWFTRALPQPIPLPGSLQQARLGDPISVDTQRTGGIFDSSWFTEPEYEVHRQPWNVKVPFWLQPETHYTGAAWYRRTIDIPAGWTGLPVTLSLERPHWTTTVWLGDREIGSNDASSTAHVYERGSDLPPGRYTLTIREDNRLDPDIGENSHSISDHTQGNWNGIVGRIELAAHQPIWIEQMDLATRMADRTALVRGRLQHREDGLASRINARAPETRSGYSDHILGRTLPVVAHEIGQWCVYPDVDEMAQYTGYLKPRNFEIFRDSLSARGMAHQARDFLAASGNLQALCYREDIESALRTPGMGGFQLLGLQDVPGQGTALVGVLNPF